MTEASLVEPHGLPSLRNESRHRQAEEGTRARESAWLAGGPSPLTTDTDRQSDQEIIADVTGQMTVRIQIIGYQAITRSDSSMITRRRHDLHLSPQNHHQLSSRWGVQVPVRHPFQELCNVHGRHWNVSKSQTPGHVVIPPVSCRKVDRHEVGSSRVVTEHAIDRHGVGVLGASEVEVEEPLSIRAKHLHPIIRLKML